MVMATRNLYLDGISELSSFQEAVLSDFIEIYRPWVAHAATKSLPSDLRRAFRAYTRRHDVQWRDVNDLLNFFRTRPRAITELTTLVISKNGLQNANITRAVNVFRMMLTVAEVTLEHPITRNFN